jgi:hypothetical protein
MPENWHLAPGFATINMKERTCKVQRPLIDPDDYSVVMNDKVYRA